MHRLVLHLSGQTLSNAVAFGYIASVLPVLIHCIPAEIACPPVMHWQIGRWSAGKLRESTCQLCHTVV